MGHGLSLPWYTPRYGPGGEHDPKVTNQRPSGTVKPHAGSRETRSILTSRSSAACLALGWDGAKSKCLGESLRIS